MTPEEYENYESEVLRRLAGLRDVSTGCCKGCHECGLAEDCTDLEREAREEPSFSWSPCDACGSSLGGNRHPAHGWMEHGGRYVLLHLGVCEDCLMYLNYGRLDDASMEEIEKLKKKKP